MKNNWRYRLEHTDFSQGSQDIVELAASLAQEWADGGVWDANHSYSAAEQVMEEILDAMNTSSIEGAIRVERVVYEKWGKEFLYIDRGYPLQDTIIYDVAGDRFLSGNPSKVCSEIIEREKEARSKKEKDFKPITEKELQTTLELHKKWRSGDIDGVQANLDNTDLSGAEMGNKNLCKASLKKVNFNESILSSSDLRETNFTDATMKDAMLYRLDLGDSIMCGVDLSDAKIRETNLLRSDMRNINMHKAILIDSDLRAVNLRNADLREAIVYRTDLRFADLTDADLTGADLRYASLRDAKGIDYLVFADVSGSQHEKVQWDMKNDIFLCDKFNGPITEFAATMEENYKDAPVELEEYRLIIDHFKKVAVLRGYGHEYTQSKEMENPKKTGTDGQSITLNSESAIDKNKSSVNFNRCLDVREGDLPQANLGTTTVTTQAEKSVENNQKIVLHLDNSEQTLTGYLQNNSDSPHSIVLRMGGKNFKIPREDVKNIEILPTETQNQGESVVARLEHSSTKGVELER
jgi:hypothetical protein